MLRCILCNKSRLVSEVSLHRFPSDPVVKKLWCAFVDKENVSANSRLCSSHFEETDFVCKPSGIKYLKKNAVPKLPTLLVQVKEEPYDENENGMSFAHTSPPRQASSSGQKRRFEETKSADNVPTPGKRFGSVGINLPNSSATSTSTTLSSESLSETLEASDSKEFLKDHLETITNETFTPLNSNERLVPTPTKRFRSVGTNIPNSSAASTSTTLSSESLSETLEASDSKEFLKDHIQRITNETFTPSNSNERLTASETDFLKNLQGDEVSGNASDGNASETSTASESEVADFYRGTCAGISKKFGRRVFFGDCSTDDITSPTKARQNWQIATKTVAAQRKKIRNLQQVKRRLEARVSSLTSLVNFLVNGNSESALEDSMSGTSRDIFKRMLKRYTHKKNSHLNSKHLQ